VKAIMFRETRFTAETPTGRGLVQVGTTERRAMEPMTAGITGSTATRWRDPALQIASGIRLLFHKYERSGGESWEAAVQGYGSQNPRYADEVMEIYRHARRGAAP
jgi:hypothetical protein